jgi:ABC-type multidrug transport system ATPase subunit
MPLRRRVLDHRGYHFFLIERENSQLLLTSMLGEEGTALCNILANNLNKWKSQVRGNIVLNGVTIDPSKLQDRVAYVKTDNNFAPDMSVRQTMLFHAFLREPGTHSRARDTKGRISALIEDLGLAQVRHTRVRDLTFSEKQRLNVACHLLLDADIVVLDQPTRGMDIFDTFFLVEYLRQWAGRGRIVILTLLPPTYEILTMISKIVLISMGKLMYYGKRREMLPYFAFIEYPCPAYKNPADYYRKHHHYLFAVTTKLVATLL